MDKVEKIILKYRTKKLLRIGRKIAAFRWGTQKENE